MKTFFPQTGTDEEWNAAYYRLEDYLRALRVVNKVAAPPHDQPSLLCNRMFVG